MKLSPASSDSRRRPVVPILVAGVCGVTALLLLLRSEPADPAQPHVRAIPPPAAHATPPAAAPAVSKAPDSAIPVEAGRALMEIIRNADGGMAMSLRDHPQVQGLRSVSLNANSLPKLSAV